MKFTFGWLRDHLDTNASLQQIGDALTDLGLEVESINDPDEEFGVFATCRVANAWRHPNADKLRVCDLELFSPNAEEATERVQVVCGAPNARTGMIGVFAPVGARVPGTGLLLKQTAIRGVKSSGMLLS
ncbi:MAG: phenylalanine--tRNA ligase subunit beta, partial [Rhodobacteraceae bacterium]|nr:phenylalanine--tRNA ligase subunit beta [Paracoccaceae bacterium]